MDSETFRSVEMQLQLMNINTPVRCAASGKQQQQHPNVLADALACSGDLTTNIKQTRGNLDREWLGVGFQHSSETTHVSRVIYT